MRARVTKQVARKEDVKKLQAYAMLVEYDSPDDVDWREVEAETGVKQETIANYKGNLVSGDYGYRFLRANNYSEEQIPEWVSRDPKPKKAPPPKETVNLPQRRSNTPPNPSGTVNPQENPTGIGLPNLGGQSDSNVANPTHQSGLATLNSTQLAEMGLMRDGNGQYFRVTRGNGGSMTLTPTSEQEVLRQQQQAAATDGLFDRVSEAAINEFNVNVQALVRKIAMSPAVFMSFSYVKAIGAMSPEDDIGDFINHCVKFTMDKGYGATPGMITGKPSLVNMMEQQRGGGFFPI
jgi:hypothetical protein